MICFLNTLFLVSHNQNYATEKGVLPIGQTTQSCLVQSAHIKATNQDVTGNANPPVV